MSTTLYQLPEDYLSKIDRICDYVDMMKKVNRVDALYTKKEAAKILKVSLSQINNLIKEGLLRTVKIKGTVRIKGADLMDAINENEV